MEPHIEATAKLLAKYARESAALESENKELRKVLKELVELKDIKDSHEKLTSFEKGFAVEVYERKYLKREQSIWESARKLSHERN